MWYLVLVANFDLCLSITYRWTRIISLWFSVGENGDIVIEYKSNISSSSIMMSSSVVFIGANKFVRDSVDTMR